MTKDAPRAALVLLQFGLLRQRVTSNCARYWEGSIGDDALSDGAGLTNWMV